MKVRRHTPIRGLIVSLVVALGLPFGSPAAQASPSAHATLDQRPAGRNRLPWSAKLDTAPPGIRYGRRADPGARPRVGIAHGTSPHIARTTNAAGRNTTDPLQYHGGPVMHSSSTYAIFWLPQGYSYEGAGGSDASYENLVTRYLRDVGNTPMYNILTQYPDGSGAPLNSSTLVGALIDTDPFPANNCSYTMLNGSSTSLCLTTTQLWQEVLNFAQAQGWTPSASTLFLLFTPLDVGSCFTSTSSSQGCFLGQGGYCAFHNSFTSTNGGTYYFANMPDNGIDLVHCGPHDSSGNLLSPNGDATADSEISTTSHEHFESVSDPEVNSSMAWMDPTNQEIGDKCAYTYGTLNPDGSNVVLNGDPYIMQEEWSNADMGCVASYGSSGGGGSVSVSPTNLSFGNQQVGTTSSPQTVTVTNGGGAAVTIYTISAGGDFSQSNDCGTTIGAGGSCTVTVTFTPTVTGPRTGELSVGAVDAGGVALAGSASLSGNGIPAGSGGTTATIQAGAGWNMVGGSSLTLWTDSQMNWSFNAAAPAWFTPTGTEPAGTGTWEYVPTAGPRAVTVEDCPAPLTILVTAHRWNLVGNPCNRSVTLPGTARAYWWDPVAQHYVLVTSITPGASAWVKPDSSSLTLS